MTEGEQQMAWNYLDLQRYIFAHDDDAIILGGQLTYRDQYHTKQHSFSFTDVSVKKKQTTVCQQ